MNNPFTRDQIKNYLLFYAAVIAVIVLFYLLNTFLNPTTVHDNKVFDTNITVEETIQEQPKEENTIRLLDKAY